MTWADPNTIIGAVNAYVWVTEPLGAMESSKPATVHIARIRRSSNEQLGTDIV